MVITKVVITSHVAVVEVVNQNDDSMNMNGMGIAAIISLIHSAAKGVLQYAQFKGSGSNQVCEINEGDIHDDLAGNLLEIPKEQGCDLLGVDLICKAEPMLSKEDV